MKSKELIGQLQKLDPTGEIEVFGDGDIYSIQLLPWYYDGRPGVLIRDDAKKPFWDVVGMREITGEDKLKIYLKCLTLEDVVWEDDNDKWTYKGGENFMTRVKEYREERLKCDYEMDAQFFFKFCAEHFPNIIEADLVNFFKTYEKELRRKGFNSLGGSINDKKTKYYKDCLRAEETLIYVVGFEEKDYNPPKDP